MSYFLIIILWNVLLYALKMLSEFAANKKLCRVFLKKDKLKNPAVPCATNVAKAAPLIP